LLKGDHGERSEREPKRGSGQWRRQTIKSGSAFKGQLYFQVGQMEGPIVPSDSREAQSAKGVGGRFGKGSGAV